MAQIQFYPQVGPERYCLEVTYPQGTAIRAARGKGQRVFPGCIRPLEMPGRGVILQARVNVDANFRVVFECEAEFVERYRQTLAAGLDVGFLQRPKSEEAGALLTRVEPLQARQLRRRKNRGSEFHDAGWPPDVLHVDAHIALGRHGTRNQSVGMRKVESKSMPKSRRGDLRPSVAVLLETPRRWLLSRIAGKQVALERASEQMLMAVPGEYETSGGRLLFRGQHGAAACERWLVRDLVRER